VRLKFELMDWPTLQEKVNNKQTQIYTMGWHGDYPDAENFLQLFYSPNIAKGTNNANYTNKAFDRLYEQIRTMDDSPRRTALYAQMAQMISEDCPVLLLSEPLSFVLTYDWVRNVKAHPFGYGFFKYHRIDTELRHKLGGRER
jgi:ABC-type transport system substrate-binding protein